MLAVTLAALLGTSAPPLLEAEVPGPSHRRVGVTFDVGVPDGAGASLVLRPWSALRLQVGPAHNGIAAGVRAGVVFSPFSTFARPTLSAQAGHFVEGNARGLVRPFFELPAATGTLLTRVQYQFATAQLGLELGSRERTSFYLRAGVSHVRARLPAFQDSAREAFADPGIRATTPVLRLTGPSAQLGFTIFLH